VRLQAGELGSVGRLTVAARITLVIAPAAEVAFSMGIFLIVAGVAGTERAGFR
jgi:hypothetical protein